MTANSAECLPPEAYAAALADLPGIGPDRLVALLREDSPQAVWQKVLSGEVRRPEPTPGRSGTGSRVPWADLAARRDIGRRWDTSQRAGIQLSYYGAASFPRIFADDLEPPGVLFWRGDLSVLDQPRVAIIGTRQCTNYGRSVATELGRDLARSGVCVISGLALGIDGAAHRGALLAGEGAGRPLGVAASGVDLPYPRRHAELWGQVASAGALISEAAPGQPAQTWRFPARNRIIAALATAVVVVESHAAGGSMLTVAAAAERGIDVLAVPGPVTSPASEGTNQLLYEGLSPVRHAGDVLAALGDLRPWPSRAPARPDRGRAATGVARGRSQLALPMSVAPPELEGQERQVLDAIDFTPTSTSMIADRSGVSIGALSRTLMHLESLGLIRGAGTWWEQCEL